jgi:hypothetical protein
MPNASHREQLHRGFENRFALVIAFVAGQGKNSLNKRVLTHFTFYSYFSNGIFWEGGIPAISGAISSDFAQFRPASASLLPETNPVFPHQAHI